MMYPILSVEDMTFLLNATPATFPVSRSMKAGPPLFPGLIAASIWIPSNRAAWLYLTYRQCARVMSDE